MYLLLLHVNISRFNWETLTFSRDTVPLLYIVIVSPYLWEIAIFSTIPLLAHTSTFNYQSQKYLFIFVIYFVILSLHLSIGESYF